MVRPPRGWDARSVHLERGRRKGLRVEITVSGTHKMALKPERATVHFSAGFEDDEPGRVLALTTGLVTELTGEITELKGAQPSPVTWYAVLPVKTRSWRPYNNQGNILPMRYSAVAELHVKFADFQALSQYVSRIGGRPGVTLGWVEWALTEATKQNIQAKVLAGAVANARERALTIARAAGASDVVPLEVADPGLLRGLSGAGGGPVPVMAARKAADSGSGGQPDFIQLAPEDIETQATVHARFDGVRLT